MSPSSRICLLFSVSVLTACQLPSLEDRYANKHRTPKALELSEDDDAAPDIDWEPALPGPDVTRDEALAYAVREVLAGMTPEQRLPVIASLLPSPSVILEKLEPDQLPVFDIPGMCGDFEPLCATASHRPDFVRLPHSSTVPAVVDVAIEAHARLVRWTSPPKVAVDTLPPIPVLASVLGELTSRLGTEELAAAALLLGPELERRMELARAKSAKPPSLTRVEGWLNSRRAVLLERAKEALTLCNLYALSWPVSRRWSLTSGFGYRVHPIYGTLRLHKGVDIAVPIGTEIRAPSAGTVRKVKEDPRNGKWIQLDHGNGLTTIFCHASELKIPKGAKVSPGDVLALSGDTGISTGPHLHYQLHLENEAVDPLRFRVATAQALLNSMAATAAGGSP